MTASTLRIERLPLPASDADIRGLALLLIDAVDSGAAVTFLAPLPLSTAEDWWRTTISSAGPRAIFLVARDAEGIVGTVQLHPAWAPNQPHRADIAKLIVHRRARGSGLGTRLMQAIESEARAAAFRLLTLDTKQGDAADRLYRRLGWTPVGAVPRYALNSDGTTHDAVIFYKELDPMARRIVIYGNAGSGKTTMARSLGLPILYLDHIAWGAVQVRAPLADSLAALEQFIAANPEWVIEGVYGDLVEAAATRATELRLLNLPAEVCIDNAHRRPWEPSYCESPEQQKQFLTPLIAFIRAYETSPDECGLPRHRAIFAAFPGPKREYLTLEG
jgi:GNAT superfamily N-acetyltransferase